MLHTEVSALRRWRYVVLHHTATAGGTVASIDASHRARGWRWGMAYHFLIGNGRGLGDGEVVAGERWRQQRAGAHVRWTLREPEREAHYDDVSIGVALVGNLEATPPTEAQRRSLRALLASLQRRFQIDRAHVIGHGEVEGAHTACPGRLLGEARSLAVDPMRRPGRAIRRRSLRRAGSGGTLPRIP